MYKHLVVDVEIAKTIEETPGGWDATDKLGIATACVWQYWDQRMRVYGPGDEKELQNCLLSADRITGYNIWKFDLPVIFGMSKQQWESDYSQLPDGNRHPRLSLRAKTDDLLRRIWQALGLNPNTFSGAHKGWSLDAVTSSTLGSGKIGHGAEAPKWYQQGLVAKVINYCCDDVALERDLCDFINKNGYVLNCQGGNRRVPTKLVIPEWRSE